ncbi:metalloendoproteinase 2-mmp [Quercus suber]|uniref:Metalloendoproteinase 2-mmp n=1 Tax=Quercus suber TaxID=58331 RepID=A0AAW0LKS1_QUESU
MSYKVFSLFSFTLLLLLLLPHHSHATSRNIHDKKLSPFEFLKHLQGCHKGEKVKGIQNLKAYLEKFGYLSYNHSQNQTHTNDDDFDELLESAIKTYQLNYHLNATGSMDANTVSTMMMPRLGADITNGTNWSAQARRNITTAMALFILSLTILFSKEIPSGQLLSTISPMDFSLAPQLKQ